jgi:hypothetical protein
LKRKDFRFQHDENGAILVARGFSGCLWRDRGHLKMECENKPNRSAELLDLLKGEVVLHHRARSARGSHPAGSFSPRSARTVPDRFSRLAREAVTDAEAYEAERENAYSGTAD